MGGENGVSQVIISYGASKDLILLHTVQLKPMIKAHISGKLVSSGISDVVITSVYSEKTRLKKLLIIIMNKSQEVTFFTGRQKTDFRYEI